jgi:hypothetical protein
MAKRRASKARVRLRELRLQDFRKCPGDCRHDSRRGQHSRIPFEHRKAIRQNHGPQTKTVPHTKEGEAGQARVDLSQLLGRLRSNSSGERSFRGLSGLGCMSPLLRNSRHGSLVSEIVSSSRTILYSSLRRNVGGDQEQVLYALLAGTGLTIGEALGLELKHLSVDCRTITVEQSCWEGTPQSPKTKNAYRQVDLFAALGKLLNAFVGERRSGLISTNRNGKPLSQTNVVRRSLHPILKELGVEKTGFHAMRRFRATWLRKQRAPEDLIRFWLGHAEQSLTDDYSKLAEDVEFRAQVAETVGTGFVVPNAMRPRKSKETRLEVAA